MGGKKKGGDRLAVETSTLTRRDAAKKTREQKRMGWLSRERAMRGRRLRKGGQENAAFYHFTTCLTKDPGFSRVARSNSTLAWNGRV